MEKHAREVEQRRKLAKIRYAYGIPGMYGSGYDGDRGISGPPVGWCECCPLYRNFVRRAFLDGIVY